MTPTCTCTYTSLCLCVCLLCGAVSCRVSRVVACYFLFVVRHWSSVVDCLSLRLCSVVCVVACCCCCGCGLLLVIGVSAYAVSIATCCLTCCLHAGSSVFFFSLSLFLLVFPLSHAPVCRFKMPPCVRSKRLRVCRHLKTVFFWQFLFLFVLTMTNYKLNCS